jgi:hypothetical protein
MPNRIPISDDGWRFLVALLKAAGYADSNDGWDMRGRMTLKREFHRLEFPEVAPNEKQLTNVALRMDRLCPHHSKHAATERTIEFLAKLEGLNDPEVHKSHGSLFRGVLDKNEKISLRLLLLKLAASVEDGTEPEVDEHHSVLNDQQLAQPSWTGSLQLEVFVASLGGKDRIGFQPVEEAPSVHFGQSILIKAKLSEPAYTYVFWIGPSGEVQPVFPWTLDEWDQPFDEREAPLSNLELPLRDATGKFDNWTLESVAGLETLVAFARRRCLTPSERNSVKADFGQLAPVRRLEIIPGVHIHTFHRNNAGTRIKIKDGKIQDVALARHLEIEKRLALWCEAATCFSFVNVGKRAK